MHLFTPFVCPPRRASASDGFHHPRRNTVPRRVCAAIRAEDAAPAGPSCCHASTMTPRRARRRLAGLVAWVALLSVFVFVPARLVAASTPPADRPKAEVVRPDRVLVRPLANASPAAVQRLFAQLGCTIEHAFPDLHGIEVLRLALGSDPAHVVAALRTSGLFAYAELDTVGHALSTPNDPYFVNGSQWPLNNTGLNGGVVGADIMAPAAWSVIHDAPNVVVAVVDSGIRMTHQDLAANLWVNPGETGVDAQGHDKSTNGIDDDGDGYVDDVHGANILNHSGNPTDDWGHGTHVAGIIGAVGNNGLGIAGIAWRVKLMAVKFIAADHTYTVSDAVTALDYARRHGAQIINASWGGYTFTSPALQDAFSALNDAGIIVVAAAGNDGSDNDTKPLYPASYPYPNIISVAATTNDDTLAGFSNYGARTVDLGAPGQDVLSCWNGSDSDYETLSGTSMACAHVTGACALLWAAYPGSTAQQIIQRILTTVDPLPELNGRTVTGGRLNLAAALSGATLDPVITSPTTATGTVGVAFSYQITATNTPDAYTATNLTGTGLYVDSRTGIIAGTPAAAGVITTAIQAQNSHGWSAPVNLTITISSGAPVIAAQTATGRQNTAFQYQIAASGSPTSYAASGLPTSLSLNPSSGMISGTPSAAGTTSVSVTATNASGTGSGVVTIVIAAAAAPTPPTVSSFTITGSTANSVTYQIVFSAVVTGVDASDFTAVRSGSSGGTSTRGTFTAQSGTTYVQVVSFTGLGGTVGLNLNATGTGIADLSGNALAAGATGPAYSVPVTGSAPVITSPLTASAAAGALFSYTIGATNSPTGFTAAGLPAGLGFTVPTIQGTVASAGTYNIAISAMNAFGKDTETLVLTVSAPIPPPTPPPPVQSPQQITFSPGTATVGQPLTLVASSSAGLPVSFQLVAGTGALSGNVLTPAAAGTVVVRAFNDGNSAYEPASVNASIPVGRGSQTITLGPLADTTTAAGSIALAAVASSGLPVALTVTGPARLQGGTLVLTGAPGVITVRASQAGDGNYQAAPDVVRSFQVRASGAQVYFGALGANPCAIVVTRDGASATFLTRLAATGEAIVGTFPLDATGSFRASTSGYPANATAAPTSGANAPTVASASPTFTVTGTVRNGTASGSIPELGATFTANVAPPSGATAALAGLYVASCPGSASGSTYLVAGPDGTAYAVVTTPQTVASGVGTLSPAGAVSIGTSGGPLTATINAAAGTITGSLGIPAGSLAIAGLSQDVPATDRLINVSSRQSVAAGSASRSVIAGFVINGTANRRVLVRAVGPALAAYGVNNPLPDPTLRIYSASGAVVAENNGWNDDPALSAAAKQVGAFPFAPGSRDAALVTDLAPGAYTAIVTSASSVGVVLVEVYDASPTATASPLPNLSSRGFVGTGEGILIAGFVITGNRPARVLIRGVGPGLAAYGVTEPLANPVLAIYASGSSTPLAQNDDWGTPDPVSPLQAAASAADLAAASQAAGAFALAPGSHDAAVLITLPPGSYTTVLRGANQTTGVGLIEAYQLGGP